MSKFNKGDLLWVDHPEGIWGQPKAPFNNNLCVYESEFVDSNGKLQIKAKFPGVDETITYYPAAWFSIRKENKIMLTLDKAQTIYLCKTLADAGRKLDAIRYWREATGAKLKEAKDFVDGGCTEAKPIVVGAMVVDHYHDRGTVIAIDEKKAWIKFTDGSGHSTYDLSELKAA